MNISNWEHPIPLRSPFPPLPSTSRCPCQFNPPHLHSVQAPKLRNPRFPGRRCRGPPSPPGLHASTATRRPGQRLSKPPHAQPHPASPRPRRPLFKCPRRAGRRDAQPSPLATPAATLALRPRPHRHHSNHCRALTPFPAMRPEGSAPRRGGHSPTDDTKPRDT